MYKQKFLMALCIGALFIGSCDKKSELVNGSGTVAATAPISVTARLKSYTQFGYGSGTFYYAKDGMLDSITDGQGTGLYVFRNGGIIDSLVATNGREIFATRKYINYDNSGRIMGYTHYRYGNTSPIKYLIGYDHHGNVNSIFPDDPWYYKDSIVYDLRHNAFWYSKESKGGSRWDTYKFDSSPNPFSQIPNNVLFTEMGIPTWFSKNNFYEWTTNFGFVTTYTMEYDNQNRLIKRTTNDPDRSVMTFTYY